jgi:hypothetical protein
LPLPVKQKNPWGTRYSPGGSACRQKPCLEENPNTAFHEQENFSSRGEKGWKKRGRKGFFANYCACFFKFMQV